MEPQPSSSSSSSSPPTSPTLDQSKPRSSTITHHSNTSNSSIFQRVASRSLRHKQKHRPPAQRELPPVPVPGPSTSSPPAFASPIPSSDPAQPSSSSAASFTTSPSAAESGHHGRRSRESSASSALSLDNGSASTGASLSSSQVSSRSVGVPRPAGEIGHPSSMDAAVASPSGGVTSGSNRGPPSSWMNRNRDRSGSVGSPRKRPSTSTGASSATEVESKPLSPRRMSSWRRASASIRAEAPEEDGAHTPLGATSRTPRSSMYGLFAGVGSESRLASASSQSPRPESAAKRLFGRSNSSRECVGSAATSSEATEEHGSEAADRKSLLRRVGSRPLLSGERDKDRGDSDGRTISTDTLCSTGATPIGMERSTATPEATMSRRRGGSISKAAGLKGWGRRKRAGASGGVEAGNSDEGKTPPLPSVNQDDKKLDLAGGDDARRTSIDSFASSMGRAAGRNVQTPNAQAQAQRQMAPPSDEGIPRRLSGWLLNMIGSDSPSGPGLAESPSPNSDDGSMRPPVLPQGRLQAHGSGTDSNAKAGLGVLNSGSSSSSLAVAGRSKAASLLSSLSSSARARTFGPEGSGSGSAGSGGGGGGGLDRALRYFLDSDAMNASSSEEGIWLLGVWHGPGASESPRQGPTIEVQQASPNATLSAERHPPAPPRTPSPTDLVASSSPAGSRVQVLARNPPTPHGSPNPHSASGGVTAPMSSSQSAANSSQNWQITFQPDFSSRIWCTYRNHFTPIARDGSISFDAAGAAERAAELAASNASAGMVPGASNKSTGYITPERAPGMVASTHGGSGRHWLGRKTSDAEASANSSPASSTFAPGGLGAALGVSSSPSQSPGAGTSPGGGGGLGEKMGIPSLWGRAASAAAGVAANLGGGGKGLTTDAGWGCMLRTGQSLLANALIVTHLGRDWRRGPLPASPGSVRRGSSHSSQAGMDKVPQEEEDLEEPSEEEQRALKEEWLRHATYARILSWFLDDPSPACAFGVHRMAREGKRLGKEVGEWFGPSTAAGAIK